VVGASGYTGAELIRLLIHHPRARIAGLYAGRNAGARLGDIFPQFQGVFDSEVAAFEPERVAEVAELAFTALPHGHSAHAVAALRERGVRVIDLSADFRLRDASEHAAWYGSPSDSPSGSPSDSPSGGLSGDHAPAHPALALLGQAVYGLPERYRQAIAGADLVACPGCYPTAAILAVAPLLERGLVAARGIIIDAKSGASGAGRSPALATHLPEAAEGVRAYKIAGAHRHTPEIEQELGAAAGAPVRVVFTPHLLPMSRGILSCVYAAPTDPHRDPRAYHDAVRRAYQDEPFVTVLAPGALPDTAHVRASNRAHVAIAYDARAERVLALAAIDNLVKGASGQAVQCMNIMCGWDETAGLGAAPVFP
jgi:N-acetyl-gamma-glutamyl-phosphate reductase